MTNQEPPTPLLRFCDLQAWLPNLSRWQLKQLEEAGQLHPVQVRKPKGRCRRRGDRGSGIYWVKSEVKRALGL